MGPQKRVDRRLEGVPKRLGAGTVGYRMLINLALADKKTAAGPQADAPGGGRPPL